ncbi:MAG: UDP-N-acetylmuramoyl-L-alanyl-D-glutamate--2,6-diaminopimelate ligase [Pirellulales bacterium]|nr:UDP-N-acetylmuramoyl-L-alanyl-D-glutamate--2,6-diaminopimelate ligase [Pirellulales bacterium]
MRVCPDRACRISLRKLFPGAEFHGAGDIEVGSCACDTRRLRPGDLFAALPGGIHDGHDFIASAIGRGASAILAQRPVDDVNVPVCLVSDVRAAFAQICQTLSGEPSRRLRVVGVTGTNGKTTTSCLIARMLARVGYRTGLLGTLGYFDGLRYDEASWTTPPADELARYLARMAKNECSHAVMEVSSHALDQSRLAGVTLDALCVTNVRRDHLDYHRTLDDYRLAKSRAMEYLSPEGFAVVNADDPTSASYLRKLDGPVLTIGIRSAAEITAVPVEHHLSEQTFLMTAGTDTVPVRTRMIGTHHIYNCLEAAAVGLAYGLDLPTIVRALEAVEYIPGRLQRIECGQPFGVFVDYAHTPDALEGCLQTLCDVTAGRVICVFGAGGDRDRQKRPLMGRAVETGANVVFLTNDNPRTEDPWAIAADLLGGFEHPERVRVVLDRRDAICQALASAAPGDCVLIAGKGHESHQILGHERIAMNDLEIAADWLYENQPTAAD